MNANRMMLEDIWVADGHGVDRFRLTMNLNSFKFITRCLRVDDRLSRKERKTYDNISHICDIFDQFVHNCKRSYSHGQCVTTDRKLEAFEGRCKFKQYIHSESAKSDSIQNYLVAQYFINFLPITLNISKMIKDRILYVRKSG